jgi:cbb3-type cytochrome oxidase maturation protein
MSAILILILASLGLAVTFLAGFIWAVKSGQFEDTVTPSMRVLSEDDPKSMPVNGKRQHKENRSPAIEHPEAREPGERSARFQSGVSQTPRPTGIGRSTAETPDVNGNLSLLTSAPAKETRFTKPTKT